MLQGLKSKARENRGRIEIDITVFFRDGTPPESVLMHTAYNKHLVESYQTNDRYTPQAAPQNTVCRMSLKDFKAAFERYADHLIKTMRVIGAEMRPNTIIYTDRSGVYFTSDCAIAGMDIHCFPCLPPGVQSNIVFDLNSQEFGDMVKVLRLLYHAGDRFYNANNMVTAGGSDLVSKLGDARNALQRVGAASWFLRMFSEVERASLEMKLRTQQREHNTNRAHVGALLNRKSFK
ncbi:MULTISPECIES: hypothetical protein [unclassified Cupriavidus]|uniref:hypothetical protein n=1 Tax=unclassified Cupriavidus TaxID=2640874 RepID=UPI00295EC63A|nr:hypothetical protein [Cupriavidus sp. TA19]